MRMAQNSQLKNSHAESVQAPAALQSAAPSQTASSSKNLPGSDAEPKFFSLRNAPVAPTPLPSHSGIAPPPSPTVTADATVVSESSDAPEFLEPVPSKDLPSAMMDALAKYEKMKSPS
jgi:hypothetical protein